jgi:hypothetical protein
MSEPRLVVNRAKCLECGDEVQSHHVHDYVTCRCGALSVDGGLDYIKRVRKSGCASKGMSLNEDDDFELIRMYLCRGSRGKNGDQPLTWIPLKDIDDEYLASLIDYKEANRQVRDVHYKMYLKEREYRSTGNILD